MIAAEYQQLFTAGGVHCLLTPTAATAARSFDELRAQSGVEGYLGALSSEENGQHQMQRTFAKKPVGFHFFQPDAILVEYFNFFETVFHVCETHCLIAQFFTPIILSAFGPSAPLPPQTT